MAGNGGRVIVFLPFLILLLSSYSEAIKCFVDRAPSSSDCKGPSTPYCFLRYKIGYNGKISDVLQKCYNELREKFQENKGTTCKDDHDGHTCVIHCDTDECNAVPKLPGGDKGAKIMCSVCLNCQDKNITSPIECPHYSLAYKNTTGQVHFVGPACYTDVTRDSAGQVDLVNRGCRGGYYQEYNKEKCSHNFQTKSKTCTTLCHENKCNKQPIRSAATTFHTATYITLAVAVVITIL